MTFRNRGAGTQPFQFATWCYGLERPAGPGAQQKMSAVLTLRTITVRIELRKLMLSEIMFFFSLKKYNALFFALPVTRVMQNYTQSLQQQQNIF